MFEMIGPDQLVAEIQSAHRRESVLVARRMAAIAALLRHRVAATEQAEDRRGYAVIDGFEQTAAEVAAAMNLSPVAASYLVSHAEALDSRLPNVAALLAEGRTDWRTVRLIISRTDLITDEGLIAQVDQSLAARIGNWHGWSRQRIVNAADAAVRAADPDAARERRASAESDRYIAISALDKRNGRHLRNCRGNGRDGIRSPALAARRAGMRGRSADDGSASRRLVDRAGPGPRPGMPLWPTGLRRQFR
jgi:hypothetical protein